ncbi:MAG: SusC/RagA family TonB-linked outer membrane protein [Mucilaginibacter sp.]|uniref:SusC/RagA family TonB-linked outer membrane protein n=1 Tax=Mucilaginibacter sp. TaxID=1882438 RepID=UPI0034E5692B
MKQKLLIFFLFGLFALSSAFAQNRKISGRVTGADDGQPLPGVSVMVEGTKIGSITGSDGEFSLSVPNDARRLVFTFIGFIKKDVPIPVSGRVGVKLASDNQQLNEVVVVGYGTGTKASNVVGQVATVSARDIENKPTANTFDALQGKVAGLQIFTSSGEPSAVSSVRINGSGSLSASSTPLYVLDGIPVDQNSILSLNPNDFENISVLKDASATSIYGARAANGVIYLTTKKGNANAPAQIDITSQYGISKLANLDFFTRFMNSQQFLDFRLASGQLTQTQVNTIKTTYPYNTQWYKTYYRNNQPTFQSTATVSGGGGKTSYYVSAGYFNQEGLAYRSKYERYTLRSNVTSVVNDWLQFGLNMAIGSDQRQTNPYTSNSTNRGLALLAAPYYSPVDANGNKYTYIPGWNRYNPEYLANETPSPTNQITFNPTGYIQLTPIKGLTIKSQAGLDAYDQRITTSRLPSYLGSLNNGSLGEGFIRSITRTITNTGEYKFNIRTKNHVTLLAGQESIDNTYTAFSGSSTGQTDDRLLLLNNGPTSIAVSSGKTEYAYHSLFGRVSYDFNSRYFVDASIRQDKSSRFGVNNRSATFWSVGGLYKISQENFLKNVTWLDDLSLRASTGSTGNSDFGVTNQNYLSYQTASTNTYNGGTGFSISTPGNPNLTWEKQQNTTFGFSASFFDRIRLDIAHYKRVTTNMLVSVPYQYVVGFSSVYNNVGKYQNTGWDVTLDFDVYKNRSKRAYITPYLNFTSNKDKVLSLFQGKDYWVQSGTGVAWVIGQPVSFVYPIFKDINSQTGLPEWYLPNATSPGMTRKDGSAITSTFSTAALQQNTGIRLNPKMTGGFGLNAGYQGFTLLAQFSYALGKNLINNDRYFFENPNQFVGYNQWATILDYWKQPGDVTTFPKYGVQFTQFDSRLIENANFMRLKVLTLGYNVPASILKKTNVIKGINIFLTGRNVFTVTKYTGPDPEVDSNLALGTNPNTKQYTVGLGLKF